MTNETSSGRGSGAKSTSDAKATADKAATEVKADAKDAAKTIAAEARSQADAAKSTVADEISGISSALRTAADEMRTGSPQERTFGQLADGLADASDAMRDKDLGTMVRDLSDFARRNPLVFLGGAALVGFVATRFAKATDDTTRGGDRP
ncbi:MAG: hypothetical protein WBA25_10885 [Jannaschia sp.]